MDPFNEQIADFTVGLMDGLTVPISVASGMVAAGATREMIILAIIAESVAGSISMGLADYISVDSIDARKDVAWKSGLRTGAGYIVGSLVPILAYMYTSDVKTGFQYSITLDLLVLGLFGYIRGIYLERDVLKSVEKVLGVGVVVMLVTVFVMRSSRLHGGDYAV